VVRLAQARSSGVARPSVSALCEGSGRDMARVPGDRDRPQSPRQALCLIVVRQSSRSRRCSPEPIDFPASAT
jgi:hypothetical protein